MSLPASVLVVDDDPLVRWALKDLLERRGFDVLEAASGADARQHILHDPDVVLLDYALPDADGLALLREFQEADRGTPIILLTAHASVRDAIDAIKHGAYHYAVKPIQPDELLLLLGQALETSRLRREVRIARAANAAPYGIDAIVGEAPVMRDLKALLIHVASGPAATVLLSGETGTGKDLAAKVIHYNSDRRTKPFVNITCSALPDQLLESELFGHERGAFTDARAQKKGLLETAHGGTVFLDEIGEMSPTLQAKLLRVLEERTFKRIGGLSDVHVDVRVIAATHRNLQQAAAQGRFRLDLFYRLNVVPIPIPPLRERREDIERLSAFFIDRYSREFGRTAPTLTPEATALLRQHDWPGNIRELRNVIERAMLMRSGPTIDRSHLHLFESPPVADGFELPSRGVDIEEVERRFLVQALHRTGGNQTLAGALLGLSRDQVRNRLMKYGLTPSGDAVPADVAHRRKVKVG